MFLSPKPESSGSPAPVTREGPGPLERRWVSGVSVHQVLRDLSTEGDAAPGHPVSEPSPRGDLGAGAGWATVGPPSAPRGRFLSDPGVPVIPGPCPPTLRTRDERQYRFRPLHAQTRQQRPLPEHDLLRTLCMFSAVPRGVGGPGARRWPCGESDLPRNEWCRHDCQLRRTPSRPVAVEWSGSEQGSGRRRVGRFRSPGQGAVTPGPSGPKVHTHRYRASLPQGSNWGSHSTSFEVPSRHRCEGRGDPR